MNKVNVINENNEIIGRVNYNENLDIWNGHNMCSGQGFHLGITRLKKSKQFVLIHGSQWEGSKNYAEIIDDEKALQLILGSENDNLLEQYFPNHNSGLEEE